MWPIKRQKVGASVHLRPVFPRFLGKSVAKGKYHSASQIARESADSDPVQILPGTYHRADRASVGDKQKRGQAGRGKGASGPAAPSEQSGVASLYVTSLKNDKKRKKTHVHMVFRHKSNKEGDGGLFQMQ